LLPIFTIFFHIFLVKKLWKFNIYSQELVLKCVWLIALGISIAWFSGGLITLIWGSIFPHTILQTKILLDGEIGNPTPGLLFVHGAYSYGWMLGLPFAFSTVIGVAHQGVPMNKTALNLD
jgi:hypothetical protein